MKELIIFHIGNQNVHQMKYDGCTGQDEIDDCKEKLAHKHNVQADDVKVKFDNENIVSSELAGDARATLNMTQIKN